MVGAQAIDPTINIVMNMIDINLPVDFIPHNFVCNKKFQELIITPDLVNQDFHTWLKKLGVKICSKGSRFFYRPPFAPGQIHVDAYDNNACKLNFIYDSFDSTISWYRLLSGQNPITFVNFRGEIIRAFNPSTCEITQRVTGNKHHLLNGSVPHRVELGRNNLQYRKCYSLLLLDSYSNKRIAWDEAITIFKPYLVGAQGIEP